MAQASMEIDARLGQVSRRWRRMGLIKAFSIGFVEAVGLLMLFMLADYMYSFSPLLRTSLLALGVAAVFGVVLLHCKEPLRRRFKPIDLALLVEERHPELQGSLLSAAEFGAQRGSPMYNYIVSALVAEADRRIRLVDISQTVDLSRLRKYAWACIGAIFLFIITGALFPSYFQRQSFRVLLPWAQEPAHLAVLNDQQPERRESFITTNLQKPIEFRVEPGDQQENIQVLEGSRIFVVAELSRSPLGLDVELFFRAPEGEWEKMPMKGIDRVYGYAAVLEDIVEPLEYFVAVGNDRSKGYKISIRQRLRIETLRLTYTYPEYLKLPPKTLESLSGDITTVKGTKVAVKIKTNQPIVRGRLELEKGGTQGLDIVADGGQTVIDITQNDTYRFMVENKYGEKVESDRIHFIKALDDKPPTLEVLGPNTDMMAHPLSEITFTVKVTEDFALDALRFRCQITRDAGKPTSRKESINHNFLPASWIGSVDDQKAIHVLGLDELKPYLKAGDSLFYHFECADRKGQKLVSDVFFAAVGPSEAFIVYPEFKRRNHPWVPPEVIRADLQTFIAAAWELEQRRETLTPDKLLAESKEIADNMIDPETGEVCNFVKLDEKGPPPAPALQAQIDLQYEHTVRGHGHLEKAEPGKAVMELKTTLAILMQMEHSLASQTMKVPREGNGEPEMPRVGQAKMQSYMKVLLSSPNQEQGDPFNKKFEMPPILKTKYERKLGRKDVKKVAQARQKLKDLKKDVKKIAKAMRQPRRPKMDIPQGQAPQDQEKGMQEEEKKKALASMQSQLGGKPQNQQQRQQQNEAKNQRDEQKKKNQPQQGGGGERNPEQQKQQQQQQQGGGGERNPEQQKQRQQQQGGGEQRKFAQQNRPNRGDEQRQRERLNKEAKQAAERTEDLARELQDNLDNKENKDIAKALDALRRAAEDLRKASKAFKANQLPAGANRAEQARREMDKADESMAKAQFGSLQDELQRALTTGYRLRDRQEQLMKAAQRLQSERKDVEKAKRENNTRRVMEHQVKRNGAAQAHKTMAKEVDRLKKMVDRLHDEAKERGDEHAQHAINKARSTMRNTDVAQSMMDAAVDIRNEQFVQARRSQEEANAALKKVMNTLQEAADVMVGNRLGALERAAETAQRIKKKSEKLAGLQRNKDKQDGKNQQRGKQQDGKQADQKKGKNATAEQKLAQNRRNQQGQGDRRDQKQQGEQQKGKQAGEDQKLAQNKKGQQGKGQPQEDSKKRSGNGNRNPDNKDLASKRKNQQGQGERRDQKQLGEQQMGKQAGEDQKLAQNKKGQQGKGQPQEDSKKRLGKGKGDPENRDLASERRNQQGQGEGNDQKQQGEQQKGKQAGEDQKLAQKKKGQRGDGQPQEDSKKQTGKGKGNPENKDLASKRKNQQGQGDRNDQKQRGKQQKGKQTGENENQKLAQKKDGQQGQGEQKRKGEKGEGQEERRTAQNRRQGESSSQRERQNRRKGEGEGVGSPNDRNLPELTRAERDAEITRLWGTTRSLVDQLQKLNYVPKSTVELLDEAARTERAFKSLFGRMNKRQASSFIQIIGKVSDSLAEELKHALAAKKLEAGVREQCPPGYRRLVSQYYQSLSNGGAQQIAARD